MEDPQDPLGGAFFTRFRARLRELHERSRPRTYLEIGVDEGRSLALAKPETLAIGVDPAPAVEVELGPGTRVFAETSDEFFAERDVDQLYGGAGIDVVFVDGLHLFEQALRDVANAGRHLSPGGCVLLHDTLPYSRVMAERRRTTEKWTGDVWKVVECLRRERADLSVVTVDLTPTGMTVIRGLDPADTDLLDRHGEFVAGYAALPAGGYEDARAGWEVVPDGDGVLARLAAGEGATAR